MRLARWNSIVSSINVNRLNSVRLSRPNRVPSPYLSFFFARQPLMGDGNFMTFTVGGHVGSTRIMYRSSNPRTQ